MTLPLAAHPLGHDTARRRSRPVSSPLLKGYSPNMQAFE